LERPEIAAIQITRVVTLDKTQPQNLII
jgi:hypothetical protein